MQEFGHFRAFRLGAVDLRPLMSALNPKLCIFCALAEVIEDVDISCDRRVKTKEVSPTCDEFSLVLLRFRV